MDLRAVIVTTPDVRGGKPCLVGTRITVEQIVTDFPELTDELVRAALEFDSVGERRTSSTS